MSSETRRYAAIRLAASTSSLSQVFAAILPDISLFARLFVFEWVETTNKFHDSGVILIAGYYDSTMIWTQNIVMSNYLPNLLTTSDQTLICCSG